jgi:hypothetical protein
MIRGVIDLIDRSKVQGWAFDTEDPSHHLKIEFVRDGDSFGTTTANVLRPDLAKAGFGAGDHGFVHRFPPSLNPSIVGAVQAKACARDGTRFELPRRLARLPELAATPPHFPGLSSDTAQFPVFVLGVVRSGTSAIARGIRELNQYRGFSEGHLLDLLLPLVRQLHESYRQKQEPRQQDTMVAHVPMQFFNDGFNHIFVVLAQQLFPAGRWVEKTPIWENIVLAPRFRRIWPNARFIFMRRRPLENLRSRARKFPSFDFVPCCKEWRNMMQAWIDVRSNLRGAALEIDQLTLARHPERVANAVQTLLGLDADATDQVTRTLSRTRVEQTGDSIDEVLDLAATGWSAAQIEELKNVCGPMMEQFGYTIDRSYYRDSDDSGLVVI